MFATSLAANADLLIASMAAVSAFGAIVVVCWPYFAPDAFRDRVRRIAGGRDETRDRRPDRRGATDDQAEADLQGHL